MIVEALYRDNHKERFLMFEDATLGRCVRTAQEVYDKSRVKHLKIIDGGSREIRSQLDND
jgi:hypothetical protein